MRNQDSQLKAAYQRTDKVLEAATQTLIDQIREKTGNPFFYGEPFMQ